MKTYTVGYVNEALQKGHWIGTFNTEDEARDYARDQASRSRSFVTYQVYRGTPKNPGLSLGPIYRGEN